ncbi:MAG: hypothetical protein HQL19_00560 [Candidatus Omnitrophica bacterium]|nr:hypothetical protein [Candidatus Omnitrophota bacterium]
MKFATVAKIVIGVFILICMIMFVVDNLEPVQVFFPIIRGKRIGLTFIIFGSYMMGAITSMIVMTRVGAAIRDKRKSEEVPEEEQELFEEE